MHDNDHLSIQSINAVTFATKDMKKAIAFFTDAGFKLLKNDENVGFATFAAGEQRLNLTTERQGGAQSWWGRAIFYVDDVDAHYRRLLVRGIRPSAPPSDAPWGERYFHVTSPDGHELSFARPL